MNMGVLSENVGNAKGKKRERATDTEREIWKSQ
jgi:hypothetical protein